MNNIFENAKFGELFVTRNGSQACYLGYDYRYKHPKIDVLGYCGAYNPTWDDDGNYMMDKSEESEWDIVGKGSYKDFFTQLHKTVDEEKLDELAKEYRHSEEMFKSDDYETNLLNCFKAGYRKAMEE